MANTPRYHVPAEPIWRLVRQRQAQWGFDDDEMLEFLGLASMRYVDLRGWMGRPMAERILRRLLEPARATAGTHRLRSQLAAQEAAWNPEDKEAARRRLTEQIQRLREAGLANNEIAAPLGITTRTLYRLMANADTRAG